MKIIMIGEAANHEGKLRASLTTPIEIVTLPREAAGSADHDKAIGAADVVVSLRFARPQGAPPFRLLHVPGAGLDGIDLASLTPGCQVCNVFEHEIPIAEFVSLAMLEWQIRLADMRRTFTPESWSGIYRARPPHGELHDATLGLIGFGRIGRAIAVRAKAFGMRVLALDAFAQNADGLADRVLPPAELPAMLGEADFVVIACPLTEQTRSLMNAGSLAEMKPSGVLINISRAEIANEDDLFDALQRRTIAGAFLDVWYTYPVRSDEDVAPSRKPFHSLPNVFATPHSSAWTTALPHRRYGVIAENIRRLLAGEPLLNLVRAAT